VQNVGGCGTTQRDVVVVIDPAGILAFVTKKNDVHAFN
jgi:hypothetical protein